MSVIVAMETASAGAAPVVAAPAAAAPAADAGMGMMHTIAGYMGPLAPYAHEIMFVLGVIVVSYLMCRFCCCRRCCKKDGSCKR